MKIENTFTVDAPIQDAWELLTNIPEITPCLPGAKLTDESDGVYSGGVKIKVGPVTSEYKGSAEFVEKDDTNYKAVINGKGRDTRGAGNAQALITAQMTAVGDKTKVDIETDLKVSGKVAQFGRGVMQDVSTKLLGQFAECLEAKIGEPAAIDGIAEASAEAAEEDAATDADESIVDKATDAVGDVVGAVADKVADLGGAAAAGVGAAASKIMGNDDDDDDDDEVLDLLEVAGGAVFKRFLPVLAIGIVVLIIIIWLIAK
jgi:carbon monoxide dehydrogenase subunit G